LFSFEISVVVKHDTLPVCRVQNSCLSVSIAQRSNSIRMAVHLKKHNVLPCRDFIAQLSDE